MSYAEGIGLHIAASKASLDLHVDHLHTLLVCAQTDAS